MGEYEIISDYSCLSLDDQDHVTVRARSTHFNPVVFQPKDLESVRFRSAEENHPGYISFHLLDGRVLLARFSEAEKEVYRRFFLVVRDALLNEPEAEELSFAEHLPDEEETRTILVPAAGSEQHPSAEETAEAESATPQVELPAAQPPASNEPSPQETVTGTLSASDNTSAAPQKTGRFQPLLLIGFMLSALYAVFVIAYYAGMSGSLFRSYIQLASLGSFSRNLIIPHVLAAVAAAVCGGLALLRNSAGMSGISSLLCVASGLLFPPYAAFVGVQAVLFGIAWKLMHGRVQEKQASRTHWIYVLDGILGTLAAIALISSLASGWLDQRTAEPAYETAAASAAASTAMATASPSATISSSSALLSAYQQVTLADGTNAGMSQDEARQLLGAPSEQQDLGDQNTVLIWMDASAEGASFTVTFSDQGAVRRGYSGLGALNEKGDVSAADLEAVNADGSYSYSQALADFGQPDSESVSVLDGEVQRYDSWTNASGDGASFSITFVNDAAVSKNSYGME